MTDKNIAEASQLLRQRLLEAMQKRGLKTREQLAELIGVSVNTINPYLRQKKVAIPLPMTLKRIRDKITEISEADAKIIGIAYSRKMSQSRSQAADKRFSRKRPHRAISSPSTHVTQPTEPEVLPNSKDAAVGRLVRQLFSTITQNGCSNADAIDPVALLRTFVGQRYQIGDMLSILTRKNFEEIDTSYWSDQNQQQFLNYANLVLEESRKCMLLVAQFVPDELREDLLRRLARNADLLWRTYKVASSVAPIDYVQDIELASKCEQL